MRLKIKPHIVVLVILFLLAVAIHLFFSLQTETFSSDESYFHIRQVDHIVKNFGPIIYDDLSYGGRFVYNTQVFHYFLAVFVFLLGTIAYKLIPALIAGGIVLVIYGITRELVDSTGAALFSAGLAAVLPILIQESLNQVAVRPLSILLVFLLVFFLLDIKKYLVPFVVCSVVLPLVDPMNFLFVLAIILFLILSKVERFKLSKLAREVILFNILITLLFNLIQFKDLFFSLGLGAFYENIPLGLLVTYFKDINVLATLSSVGILIIILGVFGFTFGFWKENKPAIYLLSSLIVMEILLLILKLSPFVEGVLYLAFGFIIMAGLSYNFFQQYLLLTKFSKMRYFLTVIFILVIFGSVLVPAYISAEEVMDDKVTDLELQAFDWMKDNLDEDAVVIANLEEGHKITFLAERKNVIDNNFLYVEDRYDDVDLFFRTNSQVQARNVLNKYGVTHIFLSERTKEQYNIETLFYLDEFCFKEVFENEEVEIYSYTC